MKVSKIIKSETERISGILELEKATVNWSLSIDAEDLPDNSMKTYRSLEIDGKKIEFDNGFQDLHTQSYQEILAGRGFGVEEVKSSIEIVSKLRES